MHSDEYGDAFLEEDETDLAYNDGFAEAFDLGEADYISSSKRREKGRRAAVRKDTGKVVGSASRHVDRSTQRFRAQNDAARLVRMQWEKRYKPILIELWPTSYGPLDAVLLRIMLNAMVSRAVAVTTEKLGGATSGDDAILVPAKALFASAAASAQRKGKITPAQREALTRLWYERLDALEKAIKVTIGGVSGETEDWEVGSDPVVDLEALASIEGNDFEGEYSPAGNRGRARTARNSSNSASPNDRRLASQALRQCAKYLLRMERRLIEARR